MDKVKIIDGQLERLSKKWDYTLVSLSPEFNYKKPVIDETKLLNSEEKLVVEHTLKSEGRGLVHIAVKPSKNDYTDDKHRGTVEYTPNCRNYSFHKVIIPDGTIIREANFTQRDIDTDAIQGEDLNFIECNLVNVLINPSWKLESCNTCQVDFAKMEAEELKQAEDYKAELEAQKEKVA